MARAAPALNLRKGKGGRPSSAQVHFMPILSGQNLKDFNRVK
jgi:hypothetical protein